jgi:hypothetical protein
MGFATKQAANLKLNDLQVSHAIKLLRIFRVIGVRTERTGLADPNNGQFGEKTMANGRRVSARIVSADQDVVTVELKVESMDAGRNPLTEPVTFYLQAPQRIEVIPSGGVATYQIGSERAFTIGVETDQGKTRMELDLNDVPGASAEFYTRGKARP